MQLLLQRHGVSVGVFGLGQSAGGSQRFAEEVFARGQVLAVLGVGRPLGVQASQQRRGVEIRPPGLLVFAEQALNVADALVGQRQRSRSSGVSPSSSSSRCEYASAFVSKARRFCSMRGSYASLVLADFGQQLIDRL